MLVIAALILIVILFVVPVAQRYERNREVRNDAGLIASQTRECLVRARNNLKNCDTVQEVGIDTAHLTMTKDVVYCRSGGNTNEANCYDG